MNLGPIGGRSAMNASPSLNPPEPDRRAERLDEELTDLREQLAATTDEDEQEAIKEQIQDLLKPQEPDYEQ